MFMLKPPIEFHRFLANPKISHVFHVFLALLKVIIVSHAHSTSAFQ